MQRANTFARGRGPGAGKGKRVGASPTGADALEQSLVGRRPDLSKVVARAVDPGGGGSPTEGGLSRHDTMRSNLSRIDTGISLAGRGGRMRRAPKRAAAVGTAAVDDLGIDLLGESGRRTPRNARFQQYRPGGRRSVVYPASPGCKSIGAKSVEQCVTPGDVPTDLRLRSLMQMDAQSRPRSSTASPERHSIYTVDASFPHTVDTSFSPSAIPRRAPQAATPATARATPDEHGLLGWLMQFEARVMHRFSALQREVAEIRKEQQGASPDEPRGGRRFRRFTDARADARAGQRRSDSMELRPQQSQATLGGSVASRSSIGGESLLIQDPFAVPGASYIPDDQASLMPQQPGIPLPGRNLSMSGSLGTQNTRGRKRAATTTTVGGASPLHPVLGLPSGAALAASAAPSLPIVTQRTALSRASGDMARQSTATGRQSTHATASIVPPCWGGPPSRPPSGRELRGRRWSGLSAEEPAGALSATQSPRDAAPPSPTARAAGAGRAPDSPPRRVVSPRTAHFSPGYGVLPMAPLPMPIAIDAALAQPGPQDRPSSAEPGLQRQRSAEARDLLCSARTPHEAHPPPILVGSLPRDPGSRAPSACPSRGVRSDGSRAPSHHSAVECRDHSPQTSPTREKNSSPKKTLASRSPVIEALCIDTSSEKGPPRMVTGGSPDGDDGPEKMRSMSLRNRAHLRRTKADGENDPGNPAAAARFGGGFLNRLLLPAGASVAKEDPEVAAAARRIGQVRGMYGSWDSASGVFASASELVMALNEAPFEEEELEYEEPEEQLVLLPDCALRRVWDGCYVCISLVEITLWTIAVSTADHGRISIGVPPLGWYGAFSLMWVIDLWVQSRTAVLHEWEIDDDLVSIRRAFLTGRLPFDAFLTIPWDLLLYAGMGGNADAFWYASSVRVLRCLRIPGLFRSSTPVREVPWWVECLFFIFWLCLAIEAFAVTWIAIASLDEQHLVRPTYEDPQATYSTAFYFTVTTITSVGFGDISPDSLHTRLHNIILQIFGVALLIWLSGRTAAYFITTDPFELMVLERRRRIQSLMHQNSVPWEIQKDAFTVYPVLLETSVRDFQEVLLELPDVVQERIARHIKIRLIMKVPIFKGVSQTLLTQLAEFLVEEYCDSHRYVIEAGETGQEMWFLHHGVVEVLLPSKFGGEVWTANLKSGSWFGEIALLQETTRVASVRSLTKCVLYKLDKVNVDFLMRASEELRDAMQQKAQKRMEEVEELKRDDEMGTMSPRAQQGRRERKSRFIGAPGSVQPLSPSGSANGALFMCSGSALTAGVPIPGSLQAISRHMGDGGGAFAPGGGPSLLAVPAESAAPPESRETTTETTLTTENTTTTLTTENTRQMTGASENTVRQMNEISS